MSNELTDVRCPCGAEFQADSYDAGFIAGSGMCQNCDAALPPKDICTCPSGDGSLVHPCPAHPAPVEQAGGDERAVDGKPRATKCPDCGEGDLMPGDLCACGYETDPAAGYACSECDGSGDGYVGEVCRECDGSGWFVTPEQARAGLTQPSGEVVVTKNESGAIVSVTRQDKEGRVLSVIAESATLTAQAEKAEVERPEVVAWQYRVTAGPQTGWSLWHPGKGEEFERSYTVERRPLMTVAQHERIVGELRAVIAQLRQHKNDYMDSGQETYRALQNEIREREAEIARLDGLVSGRKAERDAALARVAELEKQERPEGPTEGELEAAGLGYPLHKEEAVKLWYSGFRSEVITVLEAWEAIGHDIGMNPDKGELLDSLRYMLEKCEAHDAALAEVAGLRSLLNSLLCYVERDIDRMRSDRDKSDNKEIYDRSISLAMERLKAAQNAVFTTEPGCDTAVELAAQTTQAQHCVPVAREQLERLVRILDAHNYAKDAEALMALLAAAPAQAQHSVPEGWMLVECGIWTQEQVDEMQKTVARFRNSEFVDNRALAMAVADAGQCKAPEISLAELLAAAPGKEVPQAWLDVQAERRRQVEAEGWTPEHDDEHACDEIAAFACFYAMPPAARDWDTSSTGYGDTLGEAILPEGWEPKTGDRRREMVKACALTLAEIERLDRAGITQSPQPGATTASS
ncbi:hypothetical protein I5J07_12290 [Pseudomonas aeruginosa]|nr:hypothetical protein [Pseudomonas aeruginosa]MBH9492460.1 hypothetical protein [Pseudomonas aeruginosa]